MLVEVKDNTIDLLAQTWPMLMISMVVAISLRVAYFVHSKEKFSFHEELLKLLFIAYVLCLFQIVTEKDISLTGANYIPFKEIFRYNLGSNLFYRNVLGNMLLFMPYGFFIGKYTKTRQIKIAVLLALLASFTIEVTQLMIGRVFDIDDIILNVVGSTIGFLLYCLWRKISINLQNDKKNSWILDLIALLLLGGIIWFLIV